MPTATSQWIDMRLLVTVKAYPSISTKYGEAICVAGVRVDTPELEWARLFPVPFRELPEHQQFDKYQVISLRAQKHSTDLRRETWRPDIDSISCEDKLPPGGAWLARRPFVEPLVGPSMCELMRGRKAGNDGASLGLIRPRAILGVKVSQEAEWSFAQRSTLGQESLLTTKSKLERPGHAFHYHYYCEDPGCKGHKQKIVDWDLGEAYRSWPQSGEALTDAIRAKWHGMMCADARETLLFVGDQHQYPGKFLALGTFYPERRPNEDQLTLDLGGMGDVRGALLGGSAGGA